ncbi:hypothetical protein G7046_g5918 [Stylonectria norvegica]|nr:hypothetical protein G7046_g5918 [Stylonectria norvegica]
MERRDLDSFWADSNVSTRRNSTESLHATMLPSLKTNTETEAQLNQLKIRDLESMSPIFEKNSVKPSPEAEVDMQDSDRRKISLRERIDHFTWAWFTLPMSLGGLSMLICVQPHQFKGLHMIGMVLYAINVAVFAAVCLAMAYRFFLNPSAMVKSISHPREGLFFPTFFLAIATLITSTQRYAVPKNTTSFIWATQAVFWAYLIITAALAVGQYSYLFTVHGFGLQTMNPGWLLPIFPVMLAGTVSTVILDTQDNIDPLPLVVAGLTCQGLGFSVAMMMYAHMVGRLMQSGFPHPEHRIGLFMCVGPPAFTAFALIGMVKSRH